MTTVTARPRLDWSEYQEVLSREASERERLASFITTWQGYDQDGEL